MIVTKVPSSRLIPHLRFFSKISSLVICSIGGTVLSGWLFNIQRLLNALPGLTPMTPNTAVCFILSGVSLWALTKEQPSRRVQIIGRVCASITTAVGALTLFEYAFGANFGIDQLLFKEKTRILLNLFPGRMSPISAFNFLITGIALLTLDAKTNRGSNIAQAIILLEGAIAMLAIIGYSYGTSSLYKIGIYKPMAIHTAFAFLLIFTGILFARPEHGIMSIITNDAESGIMIRRLLLVVTITAFILGWFSLIGHLAGFYDAAFGFAMLTISLIFVFSILIWAVALSLHKMDLQRLEIETELEKEKDFSTGLMQNSTAPTFVLDSRHTVILWNKACEELTHIKSHDIIGTKDHWKVFYEYNRPCLADIIIDDALDDLPQLYKTYGQSTILPEGWRGENWFRNIGGKKRYLLFDAAPVYNIRGDLIACVETLQDITSRKYAEVALIESEERYRQLIQNMPVGLFRESVDIEDRFITVNPAMAKIFGYADTEEMLKLTVSDIYEDRAKRKELFGQLTKTEQAVTEETRFRKKDGTIFWGEVTIKAERNTPGEIEYFDGMIEDISERKRIEQLKNDFVSLVSHQLKTPVAEIKGYIYNMLTGLTGALTPKQREYLEEMGEISAKEYRLISDLLNVSRIERGVISTDIKPVRLSEVIDASLSEYFDLIKKKGLEVALCGLEKELIVLADKDKFTEAVANVIDNAVKFTSKGSIKISVQRSNETAVIEITDTGPGIPEEILKRLFTKEQTFHGAPIAGGGAGLGMYITKKFMLLQNGDITVKLNPAGGSSFLITIPLEPKKEADL